MHILVYVGAYELRWNSILLTRKGNRFPVTKVRDGSVPFKNATETEFGSFVRVIVTLNHWTLSPS